MMTPERFEEVDRLYRAAVELDPAQRTQYLAEACAGDEILRAEVAALLSYDLRPGELLDRPALELAAHLLEEERTRSLTGQHVGHCRLLSLLGKGGMGEVWLAEDTQLGRKVAVKLLPPEFTNDVERVQRFVREARAASSLNHPNILTIHEIGTPPRSDGGTHYLVTEYVEGETLRQRMKDADERPMNLTEVLDAATQVADALTVAHGAGIVHRDIKPENIMVRRDGIIKLLDFGLAKLIERDRLTLADTKDSTRAALKTGSGVVMGTVTYMSPEQARGQVVDARTDIFSLGVVLYEMVARHLPFEGSNSYEVLASILSDSEQQPLARYSRQVPAELERIVKKTLRKDREERYQNVRDMLLDLKSLKQTLVVNAEFERAAPSNERAAKQEFRVSSSVATSVQSNTLPSEIGAVRSSDVSSAEYLISGLKQHKLGTAAVLSVLLLAVAIGYWLFQRASKGPTIGSIAVLPFENVTHDQKLEYLSDGVTESLINSLSQLPHIKVIARSSVFSYKNQTPNLQQVAQQLDVQALLTGRVLLQGDTLDFRVELMDAQNNTQLWGAHFTRKGSELFAVQDEIARKVTDSLRLRLTGAQQEQVTKRYTDDAEAYRNYLQGRYYMNDVSEGSLNRAIPFFDQALALDPRYALAYAARGEYFFQMGDLTLPMIEAMAKGRQDVAAALRIDENLVEARTTLAEIELQYDWNFAGAEEDFRRAIELSPNYAEAHHQYGWYLALTGKVREAVAEMKLAQELDPVNPLINIDQCLPYYFGHQADAGIRQARKTLERFPDLFLAHMVLGTSLFNKGEHSAGIEELEKARAIEPGPQLLGMLGYAYAKSGRQDEARKLLVDLNELSKRRYVSPYWIAVIYAGLDAKNEAFTWLDKAYQERSFFLLFIKMDAIWDPLRSDSRFTDLLRRIGFPL